MELRVKFFALARDRAGLSETTMVVEDRATVDAVATVISGRFPALRDLLPRVAFAVNQTYVDRSHVLNDGDELAVIPPVSGG